MKNAFEMLARVVHHLATSDNVRRNGSIVFASKEEQIYSIPEFLKEITGATKSDLETYEGKFRKLTARDFNSRPVLKQIFELDAAEDGHRFKLDVAGNLKHIEWTLRRSGRRVWIESSANDNDTMNMLVAGLI